MTTTTNQTWSLRGWYGPPAIWIGLFVVALAFDILGVLNLASQSMIAKQSQQQQGSQSALVIGAIIGILFFLLPTWRRWINAGQRRKNYIVWTCIQGGVVFLRGLGLAYSLLMIPAVVNATTGITGELAGTQNLYFIFIGEILLSGVSFLFWLANTIMIPRRVAQLPEQAKVEQVSGGNGG